MPEINNSIAALIKVPESPNALDTLSKINALQLGQQRLQHQQFLYDQGGGYDPGEQSTLQDVYAKKSELRGRAANEIFNDPSNEGVKRAFEHFEKSGNPLDGTTKARIMQMSPTERKKTAAQIQQGSMQSQTAIEQQPQYKQDSAQAVRAGELLGNLAPLSGGAQPGLLTPGGGKPTKPIEPAVPLVQQVETARTRATQGSANLDRYSKEGTAASIQSAALHQMQVDANQVRLGAGATKEEAARKVVTAIGDMIPSLKPFTDSMADKSAAFQSFDKNAGIVSRAITQEVGTHAASGLDMVTKALLSSGNTNKGVDVIAPQLIGLSHFRQARANAASQWSTDHGGDMTGFESDFNKKASVAAWMLKELPSDQRKIVGEYMKKNNPAALGTLVKQLNNIREGKLDEGVF